MKQFKLNKKEVFWLIGTTLFALIINLLIFGFEGLTNNSTLNLNIHDTYLVIENTQFILFCSYIIFFGVYLVRVLRRKFNNLVANLILMISTILLVLVLMELISILELLNQQSSSWTVYPPLSDQEIEPEVKPKENGLLLISNILFGFQILLLSFIGYCGFKTGQNYKLNK
ncbi:hypothetical protein DMZ43_14725 [Meridianimaribacter sp. CL38]|uniref:hypothetical protein n=1 Tax=Meridianimaribacter sp. CL38 TaxID=2213021 RepID=UPI00103C2A65|nr:hypothetical protein [Meridianimaribacter sp. CL38]TBV24755.1 hypothetical protein DMZ43_14725 [Meridianimaribacter sp. CL38]